MTDKPMRAWCARLQWAGKKPFLFGTAMVPHGAQHHEVESAIFKALGELLPDGFPQPKIVDLLPGAIFFVPEE